MHPKCSVCGRLLDELGRTMLNAPDAAQPESTIRVAALTCPHCHAVLGIVPDVSTVMDAAAHGDESGN